MNELEIKVSFKRNITILIICISILAVLTFAFRPLLTFSNSYTYSVIIQTLIYLLMLGTTICALFLSKMDLTFLKQGNLKNLLLQFLFAFIVIIILLIIIVIIPSFFTDIHNIVGTNNRLIVPMLMDILIVGTIEEFIFRGYIFKIISELSNKWVGAILSSVLFGAWHLINGNIIQAILTTLIGLIFVLSLIVNKKANLLSVMVAHGFYDALLAVIAFVF
jgi:membrane protease YdiL (CAAX protease family)